MLLCIVYLLQWKLKTIENVATDTQLLCRICLFMHGKHNRWRQYNERRMTGSKRIFMACVVYVHFLNAKHFPIIQPTAHLNADMRICTTDSQDILHTTTLHRIQEIDVNIVAATDTVVLRLCFQLNLSQL